MGLSAIGSSLSGMMAATRRMEVVASNVANADSTGTAPTATDPGTAYRPLGVSQSAAPDGGVVTGVAPRANGVEVQFAPDDPNADAAGRIGAPAVTIASEMVDGLQARIGYEASAKVLAIANDMQRKAIDLLA